MDGGVSLTSRTTLPAATALGLSFEYLATEDQALQDQVIIGSMVDQNGLLLYPDGQPRFRLIYTNGGSATNHGNSLGPTGRARIRQFYYNGGSYSGSCAGAYIASVSYMTTGIYEPYYHIWPGRTQPTNLESARTGHFIPADSPLLTYFNFGGDLYVSNIYHNGGCLAREEIDFPSNTEVLLRYDYPALQMHQKPSCWAYKGNNQSGRLVVIGSHPEGETAGEGIQLMATILLYALDGQGAAQIKGTLVNGQPRLMNKSTQQNDPAFTKIGDRQYHHFVVQIPPQTPTLTVTLNGDDAYQFNLYLRADSCAFTNNADYWLTTAGSDKQLEIVNPTAGAWYIGVECATTVAATPQSWGYAYSGQIAVLEGAAYTITAAWPDQSALTPAGLPLTCRLHPNYPNPFNTSTTLHYDLPQTGHVRLIVHDQTGRQVAALVDEIQPPGQYALNWEAAGHSSGIYYLTLQTGEYQQTRKCLLIK